MLDCSYYIAIPFLMHTSRLLCKKYCSVYILAQVQHLTHFLNLLGRLLPATVPWMAMMIVCRNWSSQCFAWCVFICRRDRSSGNDFIHEWNGSIGCSRSKAVQTKVHSTVLEIWLDQCTVIYHLYTGCVKVRLSTVLLYQGQWLH